MFASTLPRHLEHVFSSRVHARLDATDGIDVLLLENVGEQKSYIRGITSSLFQVCPYLYEY